MMNKKKIYIKDLIFDKKKDHFRVIPNSNLLSSYETEEVSVVDLTKKKYLEELEKINNEFVDYFRDSSSYIAYIDFIKSNAKTASMRGYCRPSIEEKDHGFIKCKQLRHAIIENIIGGGYVPHDVEIGNDLRGMLIMGQNGVGKSSLMKSLGVSIIMAQAGCFVPADEYIFSPYTSIYTRIIGNDNIYKGLSSFALEMVELNAILKRADNKTLVIGDEVCKGTEHISGNSLIAATVIYLHNSHASFMFATHLHELLDLKCIKDLTAVKPFHISVDYDSKTDTLIYSRTLLPGPGDAIYGITFAKHIIHDTQFIQKAIEVKNELLGEFNSSISGKTSKYNSQLYIYECKLCHKRDLTSYISPLETHHINFQKNCDNNVVINKKNIRRNDLANLVVLCNECHDKLHNGEIDIKGYVMTSKGNSIVVEKAGKKILNF